MGFQFSCFRGMKHSDFCRFYWIPGDFVFFPNWFPMFRGWSTPWSWVFGFLVFEGWSIPTFFFRFDWDFVFPKLVSNVSRMKHSTVFIYAPWFFNCFVALKAMFFWHNDFIVLFLWKPAEGKYWGNKSCWKPAVENLLRGKLLKICWGQVLEEQKLLKAVENCWGEVLGEQSCWKLWKPAEGKIWRTKAVENCWGESIGGTKAVESCWKPAGRKIWETKVVENLLGRSIGEQKLLKAIENCGGEVLGNKSCWKLLKICWGKIWGTKAVENLLGGSIWWTKAVENLLRPSCWNLLKTAGGKYWGNKSCWKLVGGSIGEAVESCWKLAGREIWETKAVENLLGEVFGEQKLLKICWGQVLEEEKLLKAVENCWGKVLGEQKLLKICWGEVLGEQKLLKAVCWKRDLGNKSGWKSAGGLEGSTWMNVWIKIWYSVEIFLWKTFWMMQCSNLAVFTSRTILTTSQSVNLPWNHIRSCFKSKLSFFQARGSTSIRDLVNMHACPSEASMSKNEPLLLQPHLWSDSQISALHRALYK